MSDMTMGMRARVAELEGAILECSHHLLGKCDCHEKYGPNDVSCLAFAGRALSRFVETGPPPAYEHRLRVAPDALTDRLKACPHCGHAWALHVIGHQCAGTSYHGGAACSCEAGESDE